MYTLQIELKQHTPLIHFQHHQDGATLRASEVKPKLDRFIINELKGLNNVPKSWLNSKEKSALRYKLIIKGVSSTTTYLPFSTTKNNKKFPIRNQKIVDLIKEEHNRELLILPITPYFANEDKVKFKYNSDEVEKLDYDKLNLATKQDKLVCIFQLTDINLLNQIENIIEKFFLFENFGTRNNKGFGCFTVIKINNRSIEFKNTKIMNVYSSVFELSGINSIEYAFEKISFVYKHLKSGLGQYDQGGYKKSLLFKYFCQPPSAIRWEKRLIKQNIKATPFSYKKQSDSSKDIELEYTHEPIYGNNQNDNHWKDLPNLYQYAFIRAILGLSEGYDFKAKEIEDIINGKNNKVSHKYNVKIESKNGIERFKSPLVFKFIDNSIFICSNEISSNILSKKENPVLFDLHLGLKRNEKLLENNLYKKEGFIKNLETPTEFSIDNFLYFALIKDEGKIYNFKKLIIND